MLAVRLPELFPPVATLALAAHVERQGGRFVVGDAFGYTRTQRASRMRLRTSAGVTWATAPLVDARLGARLDGLALAPTTSWAPRIERTLQHAYGQAPFFTHYADAVRALLAAPHASAADLALASTAWLFARLGLATPTTASALVPDAAGLETPLSLAAVVAAAGADCLVALPDTAAHDARVAPTDVFAFAERPRRQRFDGFVAGLSALDGLFFYGPRLRTWLDP